MSKIEFSQPLVSVQWLADNLAADNLVILDASVPPIAPFTKTRLPDDWLNRGIPGALRFDYDKQVCDHSSSLPHMMPDAEFFGSEVRKLGINTDSAVLIYDDTGVYASPRAWWMFRAMGHGNVAVLDGGLPAWWQAGMPMGDPLPSAAKVPGNFQAQEQAGLFCDAIAVYQQLRAPTCTILDARSPGRFKGVDPEPRPHLRGGHMPGAVNLPFGTVLNDIHMRPMEELKNLFDTTVDADQHLIFSCGSGLSACILTLAAALAGRERLSVYDGSWSEWGIPSKLPVTTDPGTSD